MSFTELGYKNKLPTTSVNIEVNEFNIPAMEPLMPVSAWVNR